VRPPPGGRTGAGDLGVVGEGVTWPSGGGHQRAALAMLATRPGGRVVLGGIPPATRSPRDSVARRRGLTIAMARRMNEVYPRAIARGAWEWNSIRW
jgi:L-iditol 2-dehydrogenase